MPIKTEWAQIIKERKNPALRIDCEYCEEKIYVWKINGRSSGLTRTMTSYCCEDCISAALANLRWA